MAVKTTASRDITAEITYLTRALKAPTLRDAVPRLAERARAETWTHEEFLAACLQREVSARESHGGEGRIRAARFPARKALEDFDYDHQRSLRREVIAHLGTLDFVGRPRQRGLSRPAGHGQDDAGHRAGHPRLPGRAPGPVRHRRRMGRPARRRPPRRAAASRTHPARPLPAC